MTYEERLVNRGLEKGIDLGVAQGVEQVAVTMLSQGLNNDSIAQFTGLSLERIAQLKREYNI